MAAWQDPCNARRPDTRDIGETCAMSGVTARTLRFREARERPVPLRHGWMRWCIRADRGRLRRARCGGRFGFRLEEIRRLPALRAAKARAQPARTCEIAALRHGRMQAWRGARGGAIAGPRAETSGRLRISTRIALHRHRPPARANRRLRRGRIDPGAMHGAIAGPRARTAGAEGLRATPFQAVERPCRQSGGP